MTHNHMTGAELQALREACGLDRDQLGERCGVQGRSIKYWETGTAKTGVPSDVANMVIRFEAAVSADAAEQISIHARKSGQVVLSRTADPLKNEVVSRAYLALRRRGLDVRIVAFDYQAYRAWIEATKRRDSTDTRQAWAEQALAQQARPHRQDQPE